MDLSIHSIDIIDKRSCHCVVTKQIGHSVMSTMVTSSNPNAVIIFEAVFRNIVTTPWWFPRCIPVSSSTESAAEYKFEISNIMRREKADVLCRLLSLHNRAGINSLLINFFLPCFISFYLNFLS